MKSCAYCGRLIEDESPRCVQCGAWLAENTARRGLAAGRPDIVAKFYGRLLELKTHPTPNLARVLGTPRFLVTRLLPSFAVCCATFGGVLSWAFAIGFLGGFVVFECALFLLFRTQWRTIQRWINWPRAEALARMALARDAQRNGVRT